MLHSLRDAGLQVAVVSSNSEETIQKILGPEISAAVHQYSCGASLFGKASKLRATLRKAGGIPPPQSIYIGDEIRDAIAAREVGMAFGAVAWGFTTLSALKREKPVLHFKTVADIVPQVTAR